ncbi:hypothetical protein QNO07_16240 [Streptomyces sp. 549]|uniref:hypothetical protein n=1 Tax=Streptomyces sp. 549 TaxID=3049076 RepID=UPI0024C257CB|nr:hypothetical protein [Streptomyces sp. 549]MDK1474949.1 hypothetical protein [Streptomyces sp. 549]
MKTPSTSTTVPRRSRRTATAVAAAAAAVALGAPTAAQAAAPVLLDAHEMPPSSTPWIADPVSEGAGQPVCLTGLLPDSRSVHRTFRTELDTGATQVVFRARHELDAQRTVSALRAALARCTDKFEQEHPGSTATFHRLGTVDAGDGGHLYGTATSVPESSYDVHLYGVGRSGNRVTVVVWGQIGTLKTAPVNAFRTTVATALNKLDG